MEKIDFKKSLKTLYQPSASQFSVVEVPALQFVMIDGRGDPNTPPAYRAAVEWLYSVSYALKFASRSDMMRDYTVGPLEGQWWADDMSTFLSRKKDA